MTYLVDVLASSKMSVGVDSTGGHVESLENRLLLEYAKKMVSSTQDKDAAMSLLNKPGGGADPENLFRLQQMTANYNLELSMLSSLARKAVGAVETVLRS